MYRKAVVFFGNKANHSNAISRTFVHFFYINIWFKIQMLSWNLLVCAFKTYKWPVPLIWWHYSSHRREYEHSKHGRSRRQWKGSLKFWRIMNWLICESLVVVVFLKEKHTEPFVLVYSQMLAALLMSCSFGSLGLCPFGRLSHSRIIGWMINVETMRFKCCFEVVSTCFIYAENWNGDVFPRVTASPVNFQFFFLG